MTSAGTAHGTFYIDNTLSNEFTLDHVLKDRLVDSSDAWLTYGENDERGTKWDGKTLTKTGVDHEGKVSTLILAGANEYTGDTLVKQGLLKVTGTLGKDNSYGVNEDDDATTSDENEPPDSKIVISETATLEFANDKNITQKLTGEISGPGNLAKSGASTLELAGFENTYTGTTTIATGGGTFLVTGALGTQTDNTGPYSHGNGTNGAITNNAYLTFKQDATTVQKLGSNISGSGRLTQQGATDDTNSSTLILTGSNSYTDGTFVVSGILAGVLPSGYALTVNTGATYDGRTDLTSSDAVARTVSSLNGAGTIQYTKLTTGNRDGGGSFSGIIGDTNTGFLQDRLGHFHPDRRRHHRRPHQPHRQRHRQRRNLRRHLQSQQQQQAGRQRHVLGDRRHRQSQRPEPAGYRRRVHRQ
jgi:autotransporter-associated beta strand protein